MAFPFLREICKYYYENRSGETYMVIVKSRSIREPILLIF